MTYTAGEIEDARLAEEDVPLVVNGELTEAGIFYVEDVRRQTAEMDEWGSRFTETQRLELASDADAAWLKANVGLHHTWTVLDVDGDLVIVPGIHRVNRMIYLTTEEAWTDADLDSEWAW